MSRERTKPIFSAHLPDWPLSPEPVTAPPTPRTAWYTIVGSLIVLTLAALVVLAVEQTTGWVSRIANTVGPAFLSAWLFPCISLYVLWMSVESFLNARWLRRRDPDRNRGRIHFWFYFANAYNLLLFASFMGLQSLNRVVDTDSMTRLFPIELVVIIVGTSLSALILVFCFRFAMRRDMKIWVSSDRVLRRSRRANVWPPTAGGENHTIGLLVCATLPSFAAGFYFLWESAISTTLLAFVALLLIGFVVFPILLAIEKRLVAATPAECWGRPALLESHD
jgi:hypothetical protein